MMHAVASKRRLINVISLSFVSKLNSLTSLLIADQSRSLGVGQNLSPLDNRETSACVNILLEIFTTLSLTNRPVHYL
jgi:hypothetical protein